jgi:DNA polymerase
MTADEKLELARFLDLAADTIRDSYRGPEREYRFEDDAPPGDAAAESPEAGETLETLAAAIRACRACPLAETRVKAVPGEGAERPLVLVVGEGPGADEDSGGRPFIGRAGQLLDKMLASVGLSRESNCFITNAVKCRPPENRDPLPEEIAACAPFLERQIELLSPKLILCAGKTAARALLKTGGSVGELREVFHSLPGPRPIPLIVTYHPSALLRNEDYKRPAWEDLKRLRAKLAEYDGAKEAGPEAADSGES